LYLQSHPLLLPAAAGHVSTLQIILTCLPISLQMQQLGSGGQPDSESASSSALSRAYNHFVAVSCSGIDAAVRLHVCPLFIRIQSYPQDANGRWSPLQFAAVQGHSIAAKLLLVHGADATALLGTAHKSALDVSLKAFKVSHATRIMQCPR
jgi:ankyrin repeat protein